MQKSWRWPCWYLHERDGDSAAKPVMTRNHWARLVRVTSAPMVTPDLGTRGWNLSCPHCVWKSDTWKSPKLLPCVPSYLFALPFHLVWRQNSEKKSGKLPGRFSLVSSPLRLHPPPPHAHTEPLAIGHWTASLSVSLMNVSTTGEGAKTKVLLQGLHCVNILAGELRKRKWGHSLDYLLTKGAAYKGVISMCRSPLRAPS